MNAFQVVWAKLIANRCKPSLKSSSACGWCHLGYLAYKSGMFPKALGLVLVAGGVSYLVDMLAAFRVPEIGAAIHAVLAIAPTIAEIWTLVYVLAVGVKMVEPAKVVITAGV